MDTTNTGTTNIPDNYRRLLDDANELAKKLKASEPVPLMLMGKCKWEKSATLEASKKRLEALEESRKEMRQLFERNIASMCAYIQGVIKDDEACS